MPVKRMVSLGLVLTAAAAWGQGQPAPQRLYLNPGILIGSSRMIALGGAYTGIGETAYGTTANIASIATRTRTENGPWQLSPVFNYMFNFGDYDFDNDGSPDEADVSLQYLVGAQFRWRNLGVGLFLRRNQLAFCLVASCSLLGPEPRLELLLTNPTFSVGYAFLDESLVVSAGLYGVMGDVYGDERVWHYSGFAPEVGVLVRPKGFPFRVGFAARLEGTGGLQDGYDTTALSGRTVTQGIVSPGVYSFGLSFKVGEGAFAYNDLPEMDAPPPSRALDARNPIVDMFRNRDDPKSGRLLVTLQIDVVTPVRDAVSIPSFVGGTPSAQIGTATMFTPRFGLEHVTLPGRFRTRLGGYLEASPYPGNASRLHITGGTELFLLRLIDDWAATATFDLANHYYNIGFSIGTWR